MEREIILVEMILRIVNIVINFVDGVMRDCVDSDIFDKEVGFRDIKLLDIGIGVVNLRDMVGISNE